MDLTNFPKASFYSLALTSCGEDTETFGNRTFGPVITRSVLIQYCHSGSGIFYIDNNTFYVRRGDCIVSFSGQRRVEVGSDAPWRFSWLYFEGETVLQFLKELNVTPENPIISGCEESRVPDLYREITEIADKADSTRHILLGSKIFDLFAEFANLRIPTQKKQGMRVSDEYVSHAIYYMNMHYTEKDLRIDAVAQNIGLNRSYLFEIFKNKTGLSPQEYLAELRIKNACELLRLPNATVTSVAVSVGYEPANFTRAFKKLMNITPAEYVKKHL